MNSIFSLLAILSFMAILQGQVFGAGIAMEAPGLGKSEDPCAVKCEAGVDNAVNPYSCDSYYKCSNGIPTLNSCPPKLVFSPKVHVCVWPSDYACQPTCNE